ncbi:hypothetical protein FVF58_39260 [Paraburkholderia panacisoli]|uniref:Uncharacterized protein n=1 Tax=Paraburkholderia panacisoli TaxID=2603818 RepID=A0A5B0GBY7_9BURK|nr:hypothetical protein FVF58_39260 [Paraburkholderia panacisoli]
MRAHDARHPRQTGQTFFGRAPSTRPSTCYDTWCRSTQPAGCRGATHLREEDDRRVVAALDTKSGSISMTLVNRDDVFVLYGTCTPS